MNDTFIFSRTKFRAKNRFVLAPMTHNMSARNGNLSNDEINWLNNCAQGGFGILITAATLVEEGGRCWYGQPSLITKYQAKQFSVIAKNSNDNNVLAIVQLHHGGIRSEEHLNDTRPIGPTEILPNKRYLQGVKELNDKEIERLICSFVSSAIRAHTAGLHGIELHAAHNFLLCNFLNPTINRRTDQWGGGVENRSRIIVRIIKSVRKQLPRDFIIGVRLSPESYGSINGIEWKNQVEVASLLADNDIDYIHFSMIDTFKTSSSMTSSNLNKTEPLLSLIKEELGSKIPLLVAGKITNFARASNAFKLGADLVAVGTAAIGNTTWVNSSLAHEQLSIQPFSQESIQKSGFNQAAIDYFYNFEGLMLRNKEESN